MDTIRDSLERLKQFEDIVTAAPVWCAIYDPVSDSFEYANPSMEAALGAVVGRSFRDFVCGSSEDTQAVVDIQATGAAVKGFVNVYRLLDGSKIQVTWYAKEPKDRICAVGIPGKSVP